MYKTKQNIKNFTFKELADFFEKLKIPKYKAKQVFSWIYKKGVNSFDEMSDLSLEIREELDEIFFISKINIAKTLNSSDGTSKYLFELRDGNAIEAVLIPSKNRNTLCLSTQVGCKFQCIFCASGSLGFKRNLNVSEILDQVIYTKIKSGVEIDNYVFMGMGEPLDNYENLEKSLEVMNDKNGLGIASRRITISTNGIVPGIERLKNFGLQVNLAISLHAAFQEKRSSLMPVAKKYSLNQLLRACQHYYEKTSRMITFEYLLLKGINDTKNDAIKLAEIAKSLKAKVNLLAYSPVFKNKLLRRTSDEELHRFSNMLQDRNVKITIRASKGKDIKAACGQLAGEFAEKTRD